MICSAAVFALNIFARVFYEGMVFEAGDRGREVKGGGEAAAGGGVPFRVLVVRFFFTTPGLLIVAVFLSLRVESKTQCSSASARTKKQSPEGQDPLGIDIMR